MGAMPSNSRRLAVAIMIGAASVFVPQWDPEEHWATAMMQEHAVVEESSYDDPPPDLGFRLVWPDWHTTF